MSKRTPEEIIHSVERYQRGETSQGAEAKRLGGSKQTLQDWVRKYEAFGAKGFQRAKNRRYSKELKLSAVQAYLNGEGSHAAICKKYGLRHTKNGLKLSATASSMEMTTLLLLSDSASATSKSIPG